MIHRQSAKISSAACAILLRAGCAVAIFLSALYSSNPVAARTVEYLKDMATIRAAADDQGITGPFSEVPVAANATLLLENPTSADHQVIIGSRYCQAYKIENPVSVLLQDLVESANHAQLAEITADARHTLSLRILSGSTLLRCMGKNEFEAICKNRVRITAEAQFTRTDGSAGTIPVIAQVERGGRVGTFCGNVARYTGIVTREAGIELIRKALEASETGTPTSGQSQAMD